MTKAAGFPLAACVCVLALVRVYQAVSPYTTTFTSTTTSVCRATWTVLSLTVLI